jgi:uncharacterized protein (TIGR03435 family)
VLTDPGLSIFNALRVQLGVRLEPGRGPLEMLIVTAADRTPIDN